MKILALVPMRHFSERVPGKNYRPCGGLPLYHHILTALQACSVIDGIVVDTDSPVIRDGIRKAFPQVQVLERPEHLRPGTVPMNDILVHDALQAPADFYLQTHSTNPLLRPETISRAVEAFLAALPAHDSLFSVTRLQTRLWGSGGEPLNHDPAELLRTQDLPPVYEENSCLYIFSRESLLARGNRLGERPMLFEIDAIEAWDIDEELDFEIVDYLLERKIEDR
ncbi:MAG TPA: acylneuraminate cytidylyltransferase family protein [Anaerolineales bacterium]|nr:acylneuraminate cytidylyltransferase family protein [Anaerolineales bacterium]